MNCSLRRKTFGFTICFVILTLLRNGFAIDFSTVEIAGKRITVCRMNIRKERLQLFHRDETGKPFKRFDALATSLKTKNQTLIFGMNGGMYHRDSSAVGLFVSEGREIVPLNVASGEGNFFLKPNGVFAITDTGARVLESSEYAKLREHVILATQSGPLLLRNGKIHPAFNAGSTSRLIRNGVGILSRDVVVFAISEDPVNFHEFATLFRDKLHCPDALFLDGTISSLYSSELHRNDFRMDLGPILGITK